MLLQAESLKRIVSAILEKGGSSKNESLVVADHLVRANLAGHDSGDVHNHFVRLYCEHYLPVDGDGVPTGEIKSVEGTPVDFREGARISRQVAEGRFDHNYVLSLERPEKPMLLARVSEGSSGRGMAVRTDQPGVQFYTSIHMKETPGKNGVVYNLSLIHI